mgnify:CR=1 FL=1
MKITRLILTICIFTNLNCILPMANATTVKNGIKCSKLGISIKSGMNVYRCGKNPYVKPTSLTWTRRACFTANALLKEAKSQYEDWQGLAKLAGADGEATLQELRDSITELESTMKNEVCKKGV